MQEQFGEYLLEKCVKPRSSYQSKWIATIAAIKANTKGPLKVKAYAEWKENPDSGKGTAKQMMDKCFWNIVK